MKKIILAAVFAALGSATALAADLSSPGYSKAPMLVDPAANWSGFYVGINGGGGLANGAFTDMDDFLSASDKHQTGFGTAGGQVGYNWQMRSFVLGVEGDLNYMSTNSSHAIAFAFSSGPSGFNSSTTLKLDAFASVRARAGLAVDNTLLYVTGGPAWGHSDSSVRFLRSNPLSNSYNSIDNEWRLGFAAGAGVEHMLTQNLVLRAEYLYLDFLDRSHDVIASVSPTSCTATVNCRFNFANSASLARVGLSYKFK
jgi:outer membrane immunogenic protein